MDIRLGTLQHAERVSQLILASEPTLLSFLFGGEALCLNYLRKACAQPQGQFSANYHWLAFQESKQYNETINRDLNPVKTEHGEQVVAGICATWLSVMPKEFQEGTVSALRDFLNIEQIIHLLAYKDALDECFVPPELHQLCIGHVSIDTNYQQQGVASLLLKHVKNEARKQDKTEVVLDVGALNTNAIKCYEKAGFTHQHERVFEATQQRFSRMSFAL